MQEYRFVELPDLERMWKSLRGLEFEMVPVQIREADKPDAPVEKRELIIESLSYDKQGDGLWCFGGVITNIDNPRVSRVKGVFVYPPEDPTKPVSLFHIR